MGYVILPKIVFLAFVATLIGFQFLVTGCNSSTNVFYLEDEQLYIRLEKGYTPDSSRVLLGRNMSDIRDRKDYFVVYTGRGWDNVCCRTSFIIRKSTDSIFVLEQLVSSVHCTNFIIEQLYAKQKEVKIYSPNRETYKMGLINDLNYDKWYRKHKNDYHSVGINWYHTDYIVHECGYDSDMQRLLHPIK